NMIEKTGQAFFLGHRGNFSQGTVAVASAADSVRTPRRDEGCARDDARIPIDSAKPGGSGFDQNRFQISNLPSKLLQTYVSILRKISRGRQTTHAVTSKISPLFRHWVQTVTGKISPLSRHWAVHNRCFQPGFSSSRQARAWASSRHR